MFKACAICIYTGPAVDPPLELFRGLREFGNQYHASTWQELEGWLHGRKSGLVVADLDAPDIFEVLQRICKKVPACKIIGFGNPADPRMIIQANRLGCSQFVAKPVDMRELHTVVEQVLELLPASLSL